MKQIDEIFEHKLDVACGDRNGCTLDNNPDHWLRATIIVRSRPKPKTAWDLSSIDFTPRAAATDAERIDALRSLKECAIAMGEFDLAMKIRERADELKKSAEPSTGSIR